MSAITLRQVTVDLPVFSLRAQSLRHAVLNLTTGGRIMKDKEDHVFVRALDGISLDVEEGDRLGLCGHNGAGKSTLLRVMAGVYPPTSGACFVTGSVSSAFDLTMGMDPEATGLENIRLIGRYRGLDRKTVAEFTPEIADFTGLGAYLNLPIKTYSTGMRARLTFAVATSFQPDVLLMDEWIATGDAEFVDRARKRLKEFVASARVLVLATHNHSLLSSICNKILVLEKGKIIDAGPTNEVMPRLKHAA